MRRLLASAGGSTVEVDGAGAGACDFDVLAVDGAFSSFLAGGVLFVSHVEIIYKKAFAKIHIFGLPRVILTCENRIISRSEDKYVRLVGLLRAKRKKKWKE